MKRTWEPTVAGILDIISGVGFLGYIIAAYFGYENNSLRRRIWWLALAGSILAPALGLVSLILIALSKEEFTQPS
jgi:uncharacterized membrane protein